MESVRRSGGAASSCCPCRAGRHQSDDANLRLEPPGGNLVLDFSRIPESERNLARLIYLDDRLRERFVDWDEIARACAAILRTGAARDPGDKEVVVLVAELIATSPSFARAWDQHELARRPRSRSAYRHPTVGTIILDWQLLTSAENPGYVIAAVSPGDDDGSAAAFRLLAEIPLDDAPLHRA